MTVSPLEVWAIVAGAAIAAITPILSFARDHERRITGSEKEILDLQRQGVDAREWRQRMEAKQDAQMNVLAQLSAAAGFGRAHWPQGREEEMREQRPEGP